MNEEVKIDIGDIELDEAEDKKDKKKEKKNKKEMVLKEEYDKLLDLYTKAMNTASHHENLKKHYQAEYDRMMKYRSQALVEQLLPSLDAFQLAFKYDAPNKEAQNYKIGFEFVYKMMVEALQNEGMNIILPKVGEEFDSTKHQVVEVVECENEEDVNKICEVMLNGYMLKDRVIRPASVKIYRLKEKEVTEESNVDSENVN